jgi:magnesium transporter
MSASPSVNPESNKNHPTELPTTEMLDPHLASLGEVIGHNDPRQASKLLAHETDSTIAQVLEAENPAFVDDILEQFPEERRTLILEAADQTWAEQWRKNQAYPEASIGRLMDAPLAVIKPEYTVAQTLDVLRPIVKEALVTYGWVVDESKKLVGVLVFRELLFAEEGARVADLMVKDPFQLRATMPVMDAMREAIKWHLPAYPVCSDAGEFLGTVRGQNLFEQHAFELSAQAGAMVGVEREERLGTPWARSLKMRHPWLQLNVFTAFIAAAVVGAFQTTLDQVVILAVFLPVLAGQSGNTGCQALAVALRGMTLGDLEPGTERAVISKEAWLGFLNGLFVGLTAAVGMVILGLMQGNPQAWTLGLVVLFSMMGACTVSGVAGAVVPLTLRKLGADPATASSIFLTTASDVVSMGLFLGLATWFVL